MKGLDQQKLIRAYEDAIASYRRHHPLLSSDRVAAAVNPAITQDAPAQTASPSAEAPSRSNCSTTTSDSPAAGKALDGSQHDTPKQVAGNTAAASTSSKPSQPDVARQLGADTPGSQAVKTTPPAEPSTAHANAAYQQPRSSAAPYQGGTSTAQDLNPHATDPTTTDTAFKDSTAQTTDTTHAPAATAATCRQSSRGSLPLTAAAAPATATTASAHRAGTQSSPHQAVSQMGAPGYDTHQPWYSYNQAYAYPSYPHPYQYGYDYQYSHSHSYQPWLANGTVTPGVSPPTAALNHHTSTQHQAPGCDPRSAAFDLHSSNQQHAIDGAGSGGSPAWYRHYKEQHASWHAQRQSASGGSGGGGEQASSRVAEPGLQSGEEPAMASEKKATGATSAQDTTGIGTQGGVDVPSAIAVGVAGGRLPQTRQATAGYTAVSNPPPAPGSCAEWWSVVGSPPPPPPPPPPLPPAWASAWGPPQLCVRCGACVDCGRPWVH